jgi:hypothetical protein
MPDRVGASSRRRERRERRANDGASPGKGKALGRCHCVTGIEAFVKAESVRPAPKKHAIKAIACRRRLGSF